MMNEVTKLCECGCGKPTKPYNHTNKKNGVMKGEFGRFIHNHHCKGKMNGRWKGGRKKSQGYVFLYRPEHPNQIKNYVSEHRIVMEEHLGRILNSDELVHHLNGIKDDNNLCNLILTKSIDHMKLYHNRAGVDGWFKKGDGLGKKKSEETKRRMSDGAKRRWAKYHADRDNS